MNLLVLLGLAGSLFAADPLVGTWKLNVAKSKQTGPGKRWKEWTQVYEEHEGQLVGTVTGAYEDGSLVRDKYTVPNTGGTVLYTQGTGLPKGASLTLLQRKEDSHVAEWPFEMGGQVIFTMQDVVSTDGKTLTVTTRGNDAEGKLIEVVLVFDRQ
jgi:hypothetical protein